MFEVCEIVIKAFLCLPYCYVIYLLKIVLKNVLMNVFILEMVQNQHREKQAKKKIAKICLVSSRK